MTVERSLLEPGDRMAAPPAPPLAESPARVWIFQPRIEHYRLPVFDRLEELGRGRYLVEVFGPLVDGEAAGGGRRDYFRPSDYRRRRLFGLAVAQWAEMHRLIRAARPEVVIVNAHLRHLDCWTVPALCHRLGGVAVGWGKIRSFSGLPRPLLEFAKRQLFGRFDFLLAYGRTARRELLELGVPAERIHVAQNTVDTSRIFVDGARFAARGRELRAAHGLEGAMVLLCVARFDPEKRLDDLLAAWPALRALRPDLHLVLVGGGRLLEDVRSRAAEVDSARIVVTGRVPEGDDYAWIATADLTIQCGAVGLAINQSMAFAKPTIIADEHGVDTEILVHGHTGWRYPRGDRAALVATIDAVLADDAAAARITAAARTLMRDEVTIEAMANSIDACITRALALSIQRRGRP